MNDIICFNKKTNSEEILKRNSAKITAKCRVVIGEVCVGGSKAYWFNGHFHIIEEGTDIKAKDFLKKYQHTQLGPCFYTVAADVVQVEAEAGQKFEHVEGTSHNVLTLKNNTGTFMDDGMSISLLVGPYS